MNPILKCRKLGLRETLHVLRELTDWQIKAMVNHLSDVKSFLDGLDEQDRENQYFTWISDSEAVRIMVEKRIRPREVAEMVVRGCRNMADRRNYRGLIFVMVRAGYTLEMARKEGLWNERGCRISTPKDDKPTVDSLMFCLPEPVDSLMFWFPEPNQKKLFCSMSSREQLQALSQLRTDNGLPNHYLTRFGEIGLLAGLFLSHLERTGLEMFLGYDTKIQTDTETTSSTPMAISYTEEYGLYYHMERRDVGHCCMALGIDPIN